MDEVQNTENGAGRPEQAAVMRRIGRQMSIVMGVSLSLSLSLIGNLSSGHFTVPGFLISFAASTLVSLAIGFLVPVKPLGDRLCAGLRPGSLARRCAESFISDCIYTPVITLLMVWLAYRGAAAHGAPVQFAPMFLHSLVVSMVVGFVLIFVLMPLYLGIILKKNGIQRGH